MNEPDTAVPAMQDRSANVTLSRTWELELFISGATVFALLQAPAIVDTWWARTDPHLAGTANMAAFFAYYYAKLILYTLIATFVIHLVTRAYWVGLVGMHSVFPGGVRWEELKLGPAFLETYRSRLPSLETSIRRVDDLSSLLFAGGAIVLLMFLLSVVLMTVLGSVSFVLSQLLFGGEHLVPIAAVWLGVLTLIPAASRMIDSAHGKRHGTDAKPRPLMMRLAYVSYLISFTPVTGPLGFTMASNIGRRRAGWALGLVFAGIVGTFIVRDVLIGNGALYANSHLYLPDHRAVQYQDAAFYADRRQPGAVYQRMPAIQSEIIRDPYVRLFIPLVPDRHNEVIAERCPGLPEFDSGLRLVTPRSDTLPADISPLLDCVARLQPVSLDGQPLESLDYLVTRDEASGLVGLVAFIPVAGLQPGEHLLRVENLPRPAPEPGREPRAARAPFLIHFWL